MIPLVISFSDWDATWYSTVIHACALNTDIATFPLGDDTAVGTKGVSLSGGLRQRIALARAMYSRKKLVIIDDALSGLDANTSQMVFDRTLGSQGLCKNLGSTVVFATHAVRYLREADHIVALGDDGKIREQGSFQDLAAGGSYTHKISLEIGLGTRSEEQHIRELAKPAAVSDRLETAERDLARRTGDMAVYSYYAKSIGWLYGSIIIFTAIAFGFNTVFPDPWVRWWSEAEINSHNQRPLSFWVGVYIMFGVLTIISVFVHIWVMLVISVPRSSAQLHKQLLTAVIRAPYSFFVNTDSGITLNRFSNDISIVEQEMAGAVMQTLYGSCICLMSAALIAAGAEYVGTTMPVIIAVLYGIQRFYLRTSRQLRFMDLEAQAPLLIHCSETLSGVTTIRAFGWQKQSHQKCLDLLDNSQRPYYLMLCIQRWLNLVLDLTTLGIAVVVVAMAMTMRDTSSAGSVGVSMLNILSFNSQLAYLITAWTTLETSLGAVARCKNFEKSILPEDLPSEIHIPPPDWPQAGELTLTNLSASYNPDSDNVLEDMSLYISLGESLGICGRSGSGKSSLLLTLLRLLNNKTGTITLDGIDLASISRQMIRERLTALPQEAITVPGSLRDNIDPLRISDEAAITTVLRKTGLLDLVTQRRGLDTAMHDLSLSQGQMQLFAVARALLRKPKVLILDEMTSSVDAMTEETMLKLVREEFSESTVIAIAHRLKTIADFDKVVVMDKGRIVEVGNPQNLLAREDGQFRAMWERSGYLL